ncbi:MAG: RluA family pseudouridine synthase [Lachnospiraceae bacterium]|nr:RluA family pseudouridine synthase [Lachnospiraceae bacterium]
MQKISIGSNQSGQRLDKFLKKYFPGASTGLLYKMLRKKNITLNGKKADGTEQLLEGDTVESFFSEETFALFRQSNGAAPQQRRLKGVQVLYHGKDVLALYKPAGTDSQSGGETAYSLNEWMLDYISDPKYRPEGMGEGFTPSVCNRLDRNTTGLVLCGISLPGLQDLSAILREKEGEKLYLALCKGTFPGEMIKTSYLCKSPGDRVSHISDTPTGRPREEEIRTGFTPLGTVKLPECKDPVTLLRVRLYTGKTHQIRAQLAAMGHPIAGDPKYGDREFNARLRQAYGVRYQLLHAAVFTFPSAAHCGRLTDLAGKSIVSLPEAPFSEILKRHFPEVLHGLEVKRTAGLRTGGADQPVQ